MYDSNLTLMAHTAADNGYGRADAYEKKRRQALSLFWQQYVSARIAGLWSRISGRGYELQKLVGSPVNGRRKAGGLRTVSISQIRGSEGRSGDFDAEFRPRQLHMRDRWLSVAGAHLQQIPLPPVELIQVRDSYYVRDGHHRISVAKALGQESIEALVIA